MLTAIVLTLTPTQSVTLPANLGRAAHAWLLDWLKTADPAMAESLHDPNQTRPFTVSNLWGGRRGPKQTAQFSPAEPVLLRFTGYRADLSERLAELIRTNPPQTVTLADHPFLVSAVAADSAAHPWAGQTTYGALVQQYTLGAIPPGGPVLRFASPTVFRSEGVNVPLPLPKLVFDGLARRWNTHAPMRIHPDVSRFAEDCMAITRYDLRTEQVSFGEENGRGALPGFTGTCGYAFLNRDRYWMGLIHLLAAFAFYAGVGARTTWGLGQARAVEHQAE